MDPDLQKLLEGATAPGVYLFAAWYLARKLDQSQERLVGLLTGVIAEATAVMKETRDAVQHCKTR